MTEIPQGLLYSPSFLLKEDYDEIVSFIKNIPIEEWVGVTNSQNSRKVKHYGVIYDYDTKQAINPGDDYPETLTKLCNKIKQYIPSKYKLNQCIINEYLPGQGITPHIDITKSFDDYICCFTVGSGIQMDFNRNESAFHLYVEENSLYIMSGPSRYEWKHGIAPRKNDTVNGKKVKRGTRWSITFRSTLK